MMNSTLASLWVAACLLPAMASAAPAPMPEKADTVYAREAEVIFPEDYQRQKLINDIKVVYAGDDSEKAVARDSVYSLMSQYYYDQFRHFQDPELPYFMFMSKTGDLAMGIGGQVQLTGWYDWNGSIDGDSFSPYSISIPKVRTAMRQLDAEAAGSGLHFVLLGRNKIAKRLMAFVSAKFGGYKNVGFKLKKAYVVLDDWTVGYATSTFADPDAEPPVIDGAGPNGDISKTQVLVRWLHTYKDRWVVAASAEMPSSQPAADDHQTAKCKDYIPDFAALGQYQWDGGNSHVRLSGLLRFLPYRDLVEAKNHTILGWGVQLSTTFKVVPTLSIFGLTNIGQGHSSYTGDLSIGNFDLIAKKGTPGHLYAPTAFSATVGAQYFFRPDLYACLTLAEQRFLPNYNPADNTYKYGLYGAVNLFWEVTPRLTVGAEYLAGKRKNFDGTHGNANRIDAMFQFAF